MSPEEWSILISQARYCNLLSGLNGFLKSQNLWTQTPKKAKQHILAEKVKSDNQLRLLKYEAKRLENLFTSNEFQHVYLKGSAYQLLEIEEFKGRQMADIDLLVCKNDLKKIEALLHKDGWVQPDLTDYDERFYREKSQEIPPLYHSKRRTSLDVHFNILPPTLKRAPNSSYLLKATQSIDGRQHAKTLVPAGMLFHSAIHMFHESEYPKALRDLYDLHSLISHFNSQSFWDSLIHLDKHVHNGDSVYFALRYTKKYFDTNIPQEVEQYYLSYKPNKFYLAAIDWCFKQVICNSFPTFRSRYHWLAEACLYMRGHLKRMPAHLLVPHLIRKAIYRLTQKKASELDEPVL